jgi:signal transduction histidine kinase/CheY-like chemotaxis protein
MVIEQLTDPEAFRARVDHLHEHPLEISHDELLLRDGRIFERFTGPVLSAQGVYHGRIWTFRDTTERRRIEIERLVLAERMASMGRLAASVAHEINNPLAFVIAHVEQLSRDREAARDPEQLAAIGGGLERIRVIVRDLKTLSRAEEEESRAELDPQQPLEASIQMASNSVRHRARLVRRFAPTPPVLGNAARLGQVFLNLLVNAAEALPEGRAEENTITVSTSHEPSGAVRISIADTGVGIADEQRARIFDPFYTTKAIGAGTGLGLSICKGIVEAHGGTITVASQLGVGTTFSIELPAVRPAVSPAPPEPSAAAPLPAAARRARVLVIDDEPLIGKSIERLLRREHEVTALVDAREALRLFAAGERFDVIFCDLMMPHLTGVAFEAEVAATYPEILPRIAFLTGGAFAPGAETFLATTGHRCLDKPFSRGTLLEAIAAIVG